MFRERITSDGIFQLILSIDYNDNHYYYNAFAAHRYTQCGNILSLRVYMYI